MSEEELLETIMALVPESLGVWLGAGMAASAVLSLILPAPAENSHPAYKICYRAIRIFGLGAGKLKGMGKIGAAARIGAALRRQK